MQNIIDKITAELHANGKEQSALLAVASAKLAERDSIAAAVIETRAELDSARAPLAGALTDEALGTGAPGAVKAIRDAILAAERAVAAAVAREAQCAEIDGTVAELQGRVDALAQKVAHLHGPLRDAQIGLIHEELARRAKTFDAAVPALVKLFAEVMGAEAYLTQLGSSPSIRNSHTGRFCLPPFGSEPVSLPTMGAAIEAECTKLRAGFGLVPERRQFAAGLPWGLVGSA